MKLTTEEGGRKLKKGHANNGLSLNSLLASRRMSGWRQCVAHQWPHSRASHKVRQPWKPCSIYLQPHTHRGERDQRSWLQLDLQNILLTIDTHWWGFKLLNSHWLNLTGMWDKEYQDFIITLTTHFQDVVLWCFGYNTILSRQANKTILSKLAYKVESGQGNPGENYEFLMKSAVVGQSKVGTPKKRNHFFRGTIYFVTSPPSKIKVDCQSRMAS